MSQDEPNSNRLQAILNAARAVFDAKGYADATVKEIAAARAGVSKGSIYKYFASKEDIFAKVFTEAFESEHAAVDDLAREELPAAEKLQRLLDFVFERLEAFTRSGKLVMELWSSAARKGELADLGNPQRNHRPSNVRPRGRGGRTVFSLT